jgi:AcrR family transcriptional regulator
LTDVMPRKRTITDETLLDEALLLVRERGPAALSFGALSVRVGLSGSTIVQRFKTKAGLLEAALGRAWDELEDQTAEADAQAPAGPDGVVDLLVRLSAQYDPDEYADQLLLLREDLRNPVLQERGARWVATLVDAIERRLADADVAGGSTGSGPLVVAQWQGAVTLWAFTRHAPLAEVVRTSLTDLLHRMGSPSVGDDEAR